MVQRVPDAYRIDPADPRAPSQELWDRMTLAQRARVVAMLPTEDALTRLAPEGDIHRKAKNTTAETLDAFFRRIGRKIYVSSELGVYYPGEARFSPDVLAVLDVETHDRSSWVVSAEGKGLDLAIEIHVSGDAAKDDEANVERYARLGIHEYFIFDRGRLSLRGYRLPPAPSGGRRQAYRPILPQQGRYLSEVLGLDLMLEGTKLRFLLGMAAIPEHDELIAKLGAMLDEVLGHKEQAEESARREAARVGELEKELAEARAEIERLKGGG